MSLPGNHTFNTGDLTSYTASCATSPAAAYIRAPYRGIIKKFTAILGGAITSASCTVTVTNVTQGTTLGTIVFPVSGSAAGNYLFNAPSTTALSAVNEDDIIAFTPAGATGSSVPMWVSIVVRAQ